MTTGMTATMTVIVAMVGDAQMIAMEIAVIVTATEAVIAMLTEAVIGMETETAMVEIDMGEIATVMEVVGATILATVTEMAVDMEAVVGTALPGTGMVEEGLVVGRGDTSEERMKHLVSGLVSISSPAHGLWRTKCHALSVLHHRIPLAVRSQWTHLAMKTKQEKRG